MNRVILVGRIANDLELKENTKGIKQVKFTLAVNRAKEGADFISCIAWNRTAELINQYLKKGSQLVVEGHIQTGSYEGKTGKVYTTDVIVDFFDFIGYKNDTQAGDKEQDIVKQDVDDPFEEFGNEIELGPDDLPF